MSHPPTAYCSGHFCAGECGRELGQLDQQIINRASHLLPNKPARLTAEEKIKLLTDGLKQMLCTFDNPIARRRMYDDWSEDSRKFARECYEKATGQSVYS